MTNRKEREELNALSKEVFGSSSRWQKLVTNGYHEAVTEDKTETMPVDENGKGGETKTLKVQIKATASVKDGATNGYKYVTKYHTVESVKEFMLQQKKVFEEIRAQIKKHEEDIRNQKLAKQVHEENSGSAT